MEYLVSFKEDSVWSVNYHTRSFSRNIHYDGRGGGYLCRILLEQNDSGRLLTRARKQLWLSGLGGTAGEPYSSSERNTLGEGVFPSYTQ
eukprot:scaffold30559_cov69-Phaeocystis_antarctica.AAC.2